jgi:alpha-ketoglutarate-dependent taurine dioxygenase
MLEKNKFDYCSLITKFDSQLEFKRWIRQHLDLNGFLILHNFNENLQDLNRAEQFFKNFCSRIGSLVPHNFGKQDFVWSIKSQASNSPLKTFSEHNFTAPLHTDSQYREQPERYIGMFSYRQAACGGGYTYLLDFKKVIEKMQNTLTGQNLIKFLKNEEFPIAIPTVFQTDPTKKFIWSKLISDKPIKPMIRYRYDTLKAGLSLLERDKYQVFEENLNLLDSYIDNSRERQIFLLKEQEILLLDNHRLLHGRSGFFDTDRLLLRVRFD